MTALGNEREGEILKTISRNKRKMKVERTKVGMIDAEKERERQHR